MGECLFECLKEAHLERYYPNFVQRGLHSCESLIGLSMPDYPRYGVVSMEDRLHLFKLIQIIKSVQGEGASCRHKNLQQALKPNGVLNHVQTATMNVHVQANGAIVNNSRPVQDFRPREVVVKPMSLASNGLFNPVASTVLSGQPSILSQQNKPSSQPGRPLFREKPLFQWDQPAKKSPEVVFRKGSDSPVFKCRKTLQFTDSDIDNSDDESEDRKPASVHSQVPVIRTNPVPTVVQKISIPTSVEQIRPENTVHQPEPIVTVANPTMPRAFFVDVHPQNKVDMSRDSGQSVISTRPQNTHLRHAPIIQSKEPEVEHAYFPHSQVPTEQKPMLIEQVFHSNGGYNYGVPTTPHGSAKKNNQLDLSKIHVFVRKRPLTVKEVKRKELDIVKAKDPCTVIIDEPKLAVDLTPFVQQHIFNFDQVYDNTCTNEDVYRTGVKPLVKCVFNRGTATCFAFGQTGAGKTYTLLGSKTVPGMYRLAGADMFEGIKQNRTATRRLSLWVSYFEIYCGQLYDLLNKRKKLQVRENGKQKVCVTGLTETQARDPKSLVEIIQYGNLARSTGSTGVNTHSSRSHAVLQMEVRDQRDTKIGRLSFIDLAGSERASDVTDSDRQTRMEGAEINQSLLALKECIRSIDQESKHTPYRQSKLTHILRESFTGNSQTVMIANIAPSQSCCENTLNTLRYADRVKELKKDGKPAAKNTPPQQKPVVHQNNKTPKRTPPALFHPSKILFSSTPKVMPTPENRDFDLSRVLQNANESPISGHQMNIVGAPLKARRRGSFHSDDGSDGSYSEQLDPSDMNNNNNAKSDEMRHTDPQQDAPDDRMPKMTLDKVISNMKNVIGQSAVVKKETLSKSDIAKYIISTRRPDQQIESDSRRTKSMESVHICEENHTSAPRIEAHPTQTVQSTSSGHSMKTDEALIQGHRDIMSHLDQVLDKARSAVLKTSPKQPSDSSSDEDTHSPSDHTHSLRSRSRLTDKTDQVRRNLFDDLDSDPEYNSQTNSRENNSKANSRDNSRHVSIQSGNQHSSHDNMIRTISQEIISKASTSKDKSLENNSNNSTTRGGGESEFKVPNMTARSRTHQPIYIDSNHVHVKYVANSVTKPTHCGMSVANRDQPDDIKRLPASTSKLDDMRKQHPTQAWSRSYPGQEGTHLYYNHSLQPKSLFQHQEADPSVGVSNVSGVKCLDGEQLTNNKLSSEKRAWTKDLIMDIHSDVYMPLSAREERTSQRHEIEMPLSAREDRSHKPTGILYENTPAFMYEKNGINMTSSHKSSSGGDVRSPDAQSVNRNTRIEINANSVYHQRSNYTSQSQESTDGVDNEIMVDMQALTINRTDDKFVGTVTGRDNSADRLHEEHLERRMVSKTKVTNGPVDDINEVTKVDDQSNFRDCRSRESLRDSSESKSWAALLSQSNESRSLQSSHDSGISSGAHSVGIHKSSSTIDDRADISSKTNSRVHLHKHSAFSAPIEPTNKSRSQSTDSQVTSGELSNNISTSSGGILFMPIEPCPTTPREKYQITVPSVVTKTVITGSQADGIMAGDSMNPTNHVSGDSREISSKATSKQHPVGNLVSQQNPATYTDSLRTLSKPDSHSHTSTTATEVPSHMNPSAHPSHTSTKPSEISSNTLNRASDIPSHASCRPCDVPPIDVRALHQDVSQSPDSASSTQSGLIDSQNQLIGYHEEQLSDMIALCKEEMRLLVKVKSGTTVFDDYISQVTDIQSKKAHSVYNLLAQINDYSSQCQSSSMD